MGLFDWFKQLGEEKGTTVKEVNLDQEVADTNKELDKQRQIAEAQLQKIRKNQELQEEAKDRKDIAEHLSSQQERLSKQKFKGAVSVKKAMKFAKKNEVTLYSRDKTAKFGKMEDWIITTDGMIFIISDEHETPVAGGPTFGRVFANPAGLVEELVNGMLTLNVNEEGLAVDGPESKRVPRIMYTKKQGFVKSDSKQDEYLQRVAQLQQQINKLRGDKAALEQSLMEVLEERDEKDRQLSRLSATVSGRERAVESQIAQTNQIVQNYHSMQSDIRRTYEMADLYKDVAKDAQQGAQYMSDKLVQDMDRKEVDRAMEQMQHSMDFILNKSKEVARLQNQNNSQQTTSQSSTDEETVEIDEDKIE